MRIGFYGNSNNYPFMLARAMRRLGHDAQFIVDQSAPLYRPENRYPDIARPYPNWIHDVSRVRYRDYVVPNPRRGRIVDILRSCDAVVLNQYGPALLPLVRRPAVLLLTGSDLLFYANHAAQRVWNEGLLHRLTLHALVSRQRRGIRMASAVSFFWRGLSPEGDALLDELGVSDDRRMFLLMSDVHLIRRSPLPFNSPPRIFCLARLTWRKPVRPGTFLLDYKGSHIMVCGLGMFHRKTGMPLDIHLVRKGWDVEETIRLVEAEGLARLVTWHEEMTQEQVLEQHRLSDIIFDQMGSDSMVAMGGLDAMAVGRPLIANGRPEFMEHVAGEPSPICQARTAEQVCNQLERLTSDREEMQRVADASRDYVQRCFSSDRAARTLRNILDQAVRPPES